MMRVEGAAHVWGADAAGGSTSPVDDVEPPESPAPADRLLEMLDAAGVERAVCVQPRIYGYDHSYLAGAVAAHPGRIVGVGLVDPIARDVVQRLSGLAAQSIRSVRIVSIERHGPSAAYDPSSAFWRAANASRMTVSLLARPDQLGAVAACAIANPEVSVVIDHLGLIAPADPGRFLPALSMCGGAPNVHMKVSALGALSAAGFPYADMGPLVDLVVELFGADRVVAGTDWPHCLEYADYASEWRALEALLPEGEARAAILGANASALWPVDG